VRSAGHHLGVAAVVLGPGEREAVAEAIHLLRVDGVDRKAALDQRLDHRAVRDFDGDRDLAGFARTTCRHQPGRHLREPFAAVLEDPFFDPSTITVREEQVMAFRRPIDAGVPSLLVDHALSPLNNTSHRDPRRSLYWRSESRSLGRRGLPTGHRSRPIRPGTRPPQVVGPQGAVGRSRRIGSVREVYALARRPQVTLRFAPLHFARPAACLPRTA
jgi:hypothetical protein